MPRLTAEQLAARRLGMGATDVVEALGLAPWEGAGPMRVYVAKTEPDAVDTEPAGDWLEWGHTLESVILDWYTRSRGVHVLPGGHVPSRTEPWLWATLDASVVGQGRIVEAKNVGSQHAWHWDAYAEDGIPRYVRAQVTLGMHCHGARVADVVASVGGRPPHVWEVAYDEQLAELLVSGGRAFWARCQGRQPPPLDHTDATRDYLRRTYPSNVDRVLVDADEETNTIGAKRILMAEQEKAGKIGKDTLDAELLARVGTHDGIQGDGWKMTWKTGKDGTRRQRFTDQGGE